MLSHRIHVMAMAMLPMKVEKCSNESISCIIFQLLAPNSTVSQNRRLSTWLFQCALDFFPVYWLASADRLFTQFTWQRNVRLSKIIFPWKFQTYIKRNTRRKIFCTCWFKMRYAVSATDDTMDKYMSYDTEPNRRKMNGLMRAFLWFPFCRIHKKI